MSYPSEYQIGKDIEKLNNLILKLDERLSRLEDNKCKPNISKLYPAKFKLENISPNIVKANKVKAKIKTNSLAGKILNCIQSNTKMCCHEIYEEIGSDKNKIQQALVYLKLKKLIILSANTYNCKYINKLHAYYTVIENAEELKLDKAHAKKKKQAISTFVSPDSFGANVLKYLESVSEEVCAHDIAKNINAEHAATLSALSVLIKKGHVQQAEKLKLCKYSTTGKVHLHFKLTREINPDIYLSIRDEERKIANERYAKKLDKMSEVLDLDSYDQTTTYLYRDVLKIFNTNKNMEWLYSSFVGARAKEQLTTDKDWKIIEGVLDRLEQEHYVIRKKLYGTSGNKWKLTRSGNDTLLGLDTKDTKI